MSAGARVRRFFRVPRDRAIPPAAIIRLELLLVGLPAVLLAMLKANGLATPLWLLALTAVCCYGAGLVAAVLLVGDYKASLDTGRHAPATPAQQARSTRIAMLGGPVGALAAGWFSVRDAADSLVLVVLALLLFVSAGLIRGVMVLDQPKPGAVR